MLFIRLTLLVSSLALFTSCQSAPRKSEAPQAAHQSLTPPNVRVLDRPKNDWHQDAVWFEQDAWPNRWTKAKYTTTGFIRNGETVIFGGCLQSIDESTTFRSITLVSFDGMKTFREIEPFASGSCIGHFVWSDNYVAGIAYWWNAGSFFGGMVYSEDTGASWKETSISTDVQTRVGVGSYSVLEHRRVGKKNLISLDGSHRAGIFETADNGIELKWKRPITEKEHGKLLSALEKQQAEFEKIKVPISEVWLDWITGSIAFDPPTENPPRIAAE